ncbi:hypothetical protein J2X55_002250 [Microbacterium sp. 1154]|uniref:Gp37-like protein n=1 Tax=Microbacterium sp. 1154 TaxID=2817733 RepID=UPI002855141A|nr:hypothetical protein [Microbacterium sp. 1154]MDR6691338.1 hypothetical protein [Microbacterium sp. 1154]
MHDGLRFAIYDKTGSFRCQLEGVDATADLAPNAVPTATFTLDDDRKELADITANGARCGVWFRGKERFRGIIQETPGDGPYGKVTAHVRGDIRKLWHWQGRPVPSAGLGDQTSDYRVHSGPSETVFKDAVAENLLRLGVPWSVAPSLGRGTATVASLRFHPLADKLLPGLDADHLIVALSYDGPNVLVDVRQAKTVPGVLTIASGIPEGYKYERSGPTATRVVVGGRGEGVDREFVEFRDEALEADWGDIIEGFKDARNTEEGADLTIDAREALAEGRPKSGISTTLNETDRFQYGTTYTEGDLVTVRVGPIQRAQPISVSITETAGEGVVVTPRIGNVEDDTTDALARDIARLARGIRDTGRR